MDRWKGRVALVTGASSGIGEGIARGLAADGMKVVACARRVERLEALAAAVQAEGGEILTIPADVRDMAQIDNVMKTARDTWGGVDVLINNAGLGYEAALLDGDREAWRTMLEVNVLALSAFTAEAVSDMRKRGDDGHVIHIGSMAGHRIPPGKSGMYAATKHAVRALTEGLRSELRGVESDCRVTEISPGFVETEFAKVYTGDEAAADALYAKIPCIQVADIVETVRYVLGLPPHVQVHDVLMRPTRQFY